MKKSKSIALLAVLSILILSIYYVKMHYRANSTQTTLIKGYNDSGAEFISNEIYVWGRIENSSNNINNLKLMAGDIFNNLGIQSCDGFSEKSDVNGYMQRIELKGTAGTNIVADVNIQINTGSDSNAESAVTVSVIDYAGNSGMESTAKVVSDAFNSYHIKPMISTCIIGSYPGKLDNSELNDICINVFKGISAKKVENVKDNGMISVSAYSPFIKESIKVNRKDVNLNLAMRYNSYENKTYIWLAAPVITTEY